MLMIRGPMMICGLIGACVAVCGCMRCLTACRLRNCALVKHFLLCTGQDPFDDFELMVLVHEAMFESVKKDKLNTIVQVTAQCTIESASPERSSSICMQTGTS